MIFTREINDHLTSLVKKIDAEVAKANQTKKGSMGAFVVLLTDDEDAEKKLKALAEKEGIKNVSLTVDSVGGPPPYKVAKDAALTAVFYKAHSVKANHAFTKSEVTDKAVTAIVGDLSKIRG